MARAILGLDIGGANLKAAHSDGHSSLMPFELWRQPAGLTDALRALVTDAPPCDLLAITMTGELCDCFESKRQGVHHILDAVEAAAGATPILVWQTDGQFVDMATARARPLHTAAANWLALATYAGRLAPTGPALLIDVGSTTTDIIPLMDGQPVPKGRTDPERLRAGELVYTGVRRTPVCAVLGGVAAEWFATMHDVYLIVGWVAEDAADRATADGRPATHAAAHARLARMLCADLETSTDAERRALAHRALAKQAILIQSGIECAAKGLPRQPLTVLLAGSGEFLMQTMLKQPFAPFREVSFGQTISLATQLGPQLSAIAPAYALVVLAGERNP